MYGRTSRYPGWSGYMGLVDGDVDVFGGAVEGVFDQGDDHEHLGGLAGAAEAGHEGFA